MTRSTQHHYGWIKDDPDARDFPLAARQRLPAVVPSSVDLRASGFLPPVYDQGQLGSCTANAIAAALEFDQGKQGAASEWPPSRLFIYYNERVIEGTVSSDAGAQIRDGFKSVAKQGACKEATWPYVPAKFAKKPSSKAYTEGAAHPAIKYMAVARVRTQLQGALASGYPIVIGIHVYASFESDAVAKTGTVPMPAAHEQLLGGHAVLVVGYDDARQVYIVRNSWGASWGDGGYFTLPYAYVESAKLASDFWVCEAVK